MSETTNNTFATDEYLGTVGSTAVTLSSSVSRAALDFDDYYRFTVGSLSNLFVSLTNIAIGSDVDVFVYDSLHTLIGFSNLGSNANESISLTNVAAGDYFVDVYAFAGASSYSLSVRAPSLAPADFAGDTMAAARTVSLSPTTQTFSDFVGAADTNDYYRFTLGATSNFQLNLTGIGLSADADVRLLNSAGAVIASSLGLAGASEAITYNGLAVGTYYVRVNQFSGDTTYDLSMSATAVGVTDLAGSTPGTARAVALTSANSSFTDFVGSPDAHDWYTFTTGGLTNFNLSLSGLTADADVALVSSDGFTVLRASVNGSNLSEAIAYSGLAAGQYYVHVYQYSGDTNYTLTMSAAGAAQPDYAGNTTAAARDIGTLTSSTQVFADFVGASDLYDFYRFNVTGSSSINLSLTGLSSDADLYLLSSTGATLTSSVNSGSASDFINGYQVGAGTYYARVARFAGDTTYQLGLSATSSAPTDGGGDHAADFSSYSATALSVGPTATTRSDFVGDLDPRDLYSFTLSGASNVNVALTGLSADADVYLLSSPSFGSIIGASVNWGSLNELITAGGLAAGTYYIAVDQYAGNTNYTLSVTATSAAPTDFAGNTTAAARNVGTLTSTAATFSDFVGSADTNDYYRFTVGFTSSVSISMSPATGDADLQLLSSTGSIITSSILGGTSTDSITRTLDAGTYFARVYPFGGANTAYSISLAANEVSPTDAGGSLATPVDLGTIGTTTVTRSDSVGSFDTDDYYTFTLATPGQARISLTGLSADADIEVRNSLGGVVGSSYNGGSNSELMTLNLGQDTYTIHVYQYSGDTNYTLSVGRTTLADGAGNTMATARSVTLGPAAVTFNDFMGAGDVDYYRFTTSGAANFVLTMTGLTADADVQLLDSTGAVLDSSINGGSISELIEYQIASAGTYYVRVYPFTGDNTNYNLTMSAASAASAADNSMAGAVELGTLTATNVTRTEAVGSADTQDFYHFTLATAGNFRLAMTGLTADADVQLLNSSGEVIGSSTAASNISEAIAINGLAAGGYYVRVYQYAGNTNYSLQLRSEAIAAPDGAGNTLATARSMGMLTATTQVFNDFVGTADPDDYYRFTLGSTSDINVLLDGMTSDADIELLSSTGSVISQSLASGATPDSIDFDNLAAGTYYLHVNQFSGDTNYRLSVAAQAALDPAGNTSAQAYNLGLIGATARTTSGFVGSGDTSDWYSFNTAYTSNFRLNMSGMSSDADVRLVAADGTTVLSSSTAAGSAAETIVFNNLAAGNYYVQVYQYAGNTNYNLSLQAQTQVDTAPNTPTAGRLLTLSSTPTIVREYVGSADSQDYYRFTLTQRSNVDLHLTGLTGNANLELYGGTGGTVLIGSSNQPGTAGEDLSSTLNPGTYYIRVLPATAGVEADYTLTATSSIVAPADTAGDSMVTARAITVGATQTSIQEFVGTSVAPPDNADFYRFSLANMAGLRVQLTGMVEDSAQVALLNAGGSTQAAARTTTDSTGTYLEFDSLAAGTYYLDVTPTGGSSYAPYVLGVRTVVADDFAATTATTGRVTAGGLAATGRIEVGGDVDWFKVALTSGVRYVIRESGAPSANGTLADTVIRGIYNSAGVLIDGTSNDDSNASLDSMVVFTPNATGDYYIAASGFGSGTGTYRVSVGIQNQAPVIGAPLAPLTAVEGHAFSFRLPWQLFTDPEHESVTVTAMQADGRPLPSWLQFDPEAQTLYTPAGMTVPVNAPDITVRLTGTDPENASTSTNLVIRTAAGSDDYAASTSTSGSVSVGGTARGNIEAAYDADWFGVSLTGGTSYTFDLRGAPSGHGTNGDPLITGIYDASGAFISGTYNDDYGGSHDARVVYTPTSSGTYYVGASSYGGSTGTYELGVTSTSTNHAPVISNPIPDQHIREGTAFSYTIPANAFTDPDGQALSYSMSTVGGTTPTWLQFNAATRTFSGTAPSNSPDVVVNVTARDSGGMSTTDQLTFFTDAAAVANDRWTIMVYMAADNNLESFAIGDLNEMEFVNLPSNVNLVVLVDRAAGFDSSNGNWTDTRRGQIIYDTDAGLVRSTLTSIGEANSGDPGTLTSFLNWGVQNYRADNYGLVIWDHGGGLAGVAWDDASGGANLSIAETTRAISNSSVGHLDFLGFDTCLQGMVEQAVDVRTVTDVVVASQMTEPGDGWDYTGWLRQLASNSSMTEQQLATAAVNSYGTFYGNRETMAAVNTSLLDELNTAIDTFVFAASDMTATDRSNLLAARNTATVSDSDFSNFRDLGDYMHDISVNGAIAADIRAAAGGVITALDNAVFAQTSTSGFNGLSINVPLFLTADYNSNNYHFLAETHWRAYIDNLV